MDPFQDADLAICDLTITYERESAVDFTMPFMNLGTGVSNSLSRPIYTIKLTTMLFYPIRSLGISILYRKPEEKEPDLFSFLSPLSTDVWIYMATAFLAVSIMLFLQAR